MKKSKKILSLVLAAVLLFSCLGTGSAAIKVDEDCYPTIVIPGLFQSETKYYVDGEEATNINGEPYAAPFFMDTTAEIAGEALTKALIPIASLLVKQEDKEAMAANAVADILGETLIGKQKCDENGDFINDIRATKYDVSLGELPQEDQEKILDHFPLQYYMEHAGAEKLYIFSYASLGNMIDTTNELYEYIQYVKERTGYDKVNLVPVSQGGSIANALLEMYAEKDIPLSTDIDRIVYVVPALDGSTLVGEVYEFGLLDDDYEVYCDMLPALLGEDNVVSYLINVILRIMPNADLNNILDQAADTLIRDYTRYSTLMWGLCPTDNYPGSREKYLTDDSTKIIVEEADWFYKAQLNSDDNILAAIDSGVDVFNIVDYNVPLFHIVDSWDDINADGIIQLDSTSMGAFSLSIDEKLPEDYVPTHSNCTDPEHHDHTDPYGLIDPCTALLPETTFYFYGQAHEKTASNDVIMKLACTLMFDSSFESVHTYPDRFPQFNNFRLTKKLMADVDEMRAYDTSALSADDKAELESAIAQVDVMLENTVIDMQEVEAAENRFYAIRDKIVDGEQEAADDSASGIDLTALILKIFKYLSDFLYNKFGGAGFSEM